jgi:hypothetical protein
MKSKIKLILKMIYVLIPRIIRQQVLDDPIYLYKEVLKKAINKIKKGKKSSFALVNEIKALRCNYEENFMQLFARVFITSKIDKSIANLSKLFDSLSKEELVKIIFYIEKYMQKQEEHIAYEKELWKQREDHIQKIQLSFGWKVGSLIDKLRG